MLSNTFQLIGLKLLHVSLYQDYSTACPNRIFFWEDYTSSLGYLKNTQPHRSLNQCCHIVWTRLITWVTLIYYLPAYVAVNITILAAKKPSHLGVTPEVSVSFLLMCNSSEINHSRTKIQKSSEQIRICRKCSHFPSTCQRMRCILCRLRWKCARFPLRMRAFSIEVVFVKSQGCFKKAANFVKEVDTIRGYKSNCCFELRLHCDIGIVILIHL